jgi:hypothetical protein
MHPGPINRGVEITSEVADSHQSVILNQVENGVAIRMAVIYLLALKIQYKSSNLADIVILKIPMKVDQKGTQYNKDTQGDFTFFLMKVTHQYKTFEKQNIIIDLLYHKDLTIDDVNCYCNYLSSIKGKKIFYNCYFRLDYNAVPDTLTVVPSILKSMRMKRRAQRQLLLKPQTQQRPASARLFV